MLELLGANGRLRLLSLFFAIVAWAYVRFIGPLLAPQGSEVHLTIPISMVGLRHGESVHYDPQEVTVVVVGPAQTDISLRAVLDLGERLPGQYRLPVSIVATEAILSLAPANVTVTIDKESS